MTFPRRIQKTKCEHQCFGCLTTIPIGSTCQYSFDIISSNKRDTQSIYMCEKCEEHLQNCDDCLDSWHDWELYEGFYLKCIQN